MTWNVYGGMENKSVRKNFANSGDGQTWNQKALQMLFTGVI